jgi:hypothetical protein
MMAIFMSFAKIFAVNDLQVDAVLYRPCEKYMLCILALFFATLTAILFCFRPQLQGHHQALLEQLTSSVDPALVLHLTTLILFQAVSQTMLHASGRFVSHILTYLQSHVTAEIFNALQQYHGEFFVYHLQTKD